MHACGMQYSRGLVPFMGNPPRGEAMNMLVLMWHHVS